MNTPGGAWPRTSLPIPPRAKPRSQPAAAEQDMLWVGGTGCKAHSRTEVQQDREPHGLFRLPREPVCVIGRAPPRKDPGATGAAIPSRRFGAAAFTHGQHGMRLNPAADCARRPGSSLRLIFFPTFIRTPCRHQLVHTAGQGGTGKPPPENQEGGPPAKALAIPRHGDPEHRDCTPSGGVGRAPRRARTADKQPHGEEGYPHEGTDRGAGLRGDPWELDMETWPLVQIHLTTSSKPPPRKYFFLLRSWRPHAGQPPLEVCASSPLFSFFLNHTPPDPVKTPSHKLRARHHTHPKPRLRGSDCTGTQQANARP